jgi:hypothetical protein
LGEERGSIAKEADLSGRRAGSGIHLGKGRGRIVTKAAKRATKGKKKAVHGAHSKGPVDLKALREQIGRLVAAQMEEMTNANCEEAAKGHLAQHRYLLEVIGLFPGTAAGEAEATEGNDLAQALLKSFEFPNQLPQDEEGEEVAPPAGVGRDSVE